MNGSTMLIVVLLLGRQSLFQLAAHEDKEQREERNACFITI